jgi:hypothetical protein
MLPVSYALDNLPADVRNLFGPVVNMFMPEMREEHTIARDSGVLAIEGAAGE